jgi:glycosyltransferase involved in cell wall biosynthesis
MLYETTTTERLDTVPPESSPDRRSPARRLRILVLLPFAPRLDAPHGGRSTAALVARLAERHDVGLLCLRKPDEEPVDDLLRDRCDLVEEVMLEGVGARWRKPRLLWALAQGRPVEVADTFHPDFTRRARALVTDWRPNVLHLELERMAQYLDGLDCRTARVLVAVEPAGATASDLYRSSRGMERLVRYLDLTAWRRFEPKALGCVEAIVCYTDRDRRLLSALAPDVLTRTIPLAVDLPEQASDPLGSKAPNILFIGGFGHPPNVDGAVRLATCIFPEIRTRCPGAILYLVGNKPPRSVRRLARNDVVVTGSVSSVAPYLARANVVVAPLRLGGGMRVKVVEALAAGKAVVASPLAAEGIAMSPTDDHLVVAKSEEDFVASVSRLLDDPEARSALAGRARKWAEAQLDWKAIVDAYENVYDSVLKNDSRAEPVS